MRRVQSGTILFAILTTGLWAQEPQASGQEQRQTTENQQPPDRGVARISLLNGEVSVRRGDSGDVVAAGLNAPMMVEDRLLTASSSRAEIQFDSANMLRVASNAEVRMGELQYRRYQAQLAIGTVTLRILRRSDAQVELDTPILGVHPLRIGIYRVTVKEDGSTEITVREGEAEILTRNGTEHLRAGSTMLARGTEADPEFQIVAEYGPDEFDRWNASRDQTLIRSQSYQRVSPDINGAEDLDGHGRWVQDPTYGQVWAPTVDPGWAPYQEGRWVWEDWYGWTWVSADPWGWAPYHYGRWFYGSAGWSWFPGPLYGHHYYSPALVGFFGFGGGGIGVGFGFGNVGWVALAPYERFSPWWGRGFYGSHTSIINNTRIVNNVAVTNIYRNARVANGVVSVNSANFGRGGARYSTTSGFNVQNAGMVRGALPVSPSRNSLGFSDRQVRGAATSQSRASSFYGRGSAAQSQRIPFEQQRQTMNQVARSQSFGGSQAGTAARGGWQPANQGGQASGGAGSSAAHGWQRFGEPVHGTSGVGSATSGRTAGSAYQSPAGGQSAPRSFGGSYSSGGSSRISQPMVHERPASTAPRSSASGSTSSGSSRGSSGSSHSSGTSGGHHGK